MSNINYLEISYPNFALGAIIDPEEANQNNFEIVNKINDTVMEINKHTSSITNLTSVKADVTFVNNLISNLAGSGRTNETIRQNFLNLNNHKSSADHDGRYYTKIQLDNGQLDARYYIKSEINTNVSNLTSLISTNATNLNNHKSSTDHDGRYYTKTELQSGSLDTRYYTKNDMIPIINDVNFAKSTATSANNKSDFAVARANTAMHLVDGMEDAIRQYDIYVTERISELANLLGYAMLDFGYFTGKPYSLYNIDGGTFLNIPEIELDVMNNAPIVV